LVSINILVYTARLVAATASASLPGTVPGRDVVSRWYRSLSIRHQGWPDSVDLSSATDEERRYFITFLVAQVTGLIVSASIHDAW